MALKTKNLPGSNNSGNISKTLGPGNHTCKINAIRLEEFRYKPGRFYLILSMEGYEIEGFEGFFIDSNDHTKGRHKGQVGEVKTSEWAYGDGVTKSGIEIKRDDEILKIISSLCKTLDITKWLDEQDGKHETVEALIEAFNKEKPFADKFVDYCIAGKEYNNKKGYKAYELFLPKFTKNGWPFGAKVAIFNPDEHIVRKNVETVPEFESGSPSIEIQGDGKDEFKL